jgi:hypothetical protein
LAVDFGEHAQDLRFVAHIGLYGDGSAACVLNLLNHAPSSRRVIGVIHSHSPTMLSGQNRGGSPNASAGAGD